MNRKSKGLGRGLESLLGPSAPFPGSDALAAPDRATNAGAGVLRQRAAYGGAAAGADGRAAGGVIPGAGVPGGAIPGSAIPGGGHPGRAGPFDAVSPAEAAGERVQPMPLERVRAGQYQPRTRMDEDSLKQLASSIAEHGILQPIIVRPVGAGDFEIIAGERRFRAAALAGMKEVPVIVRAVPDEHALALALIENIQREDLNPLEEAAAIKRLIDEFRFTHEKAAQSIGRSRSATSNLLRLLNLADHVQSMLMEGRLEMGHARCLLPLARADQVRLAEHIVQRGLNVREAERLAQQALAASESAAAAGAAAADDAAAGAAGSARGGRLDPDVRRVQDRLADHLGARVELFPSSGGKGRLVIHFGDNDGFSALVARMNAADALDAARD